MGQLVGLARVSSQGQGLEAQLTKLAKINCECIFSSKHSGKDKGANSDKPKKLIDSVHEGDTMVVT